MMGDYMNIGYYSSARTAHISNFMLLHSALTYIDFIVGGEIKCFIFFFLSNILYIGIRYTV